MARARRRPPRLPSDAAQRAAAARLPRAAPDSRRPAHRAYTAQANCAGRHQRRHPELRAEGRCVDAARREAKDRAWALMAASFLPYENLEMQGDSGEFGR